MYDEVHDKNNVLFPVVHQKGLSSAFGGILVEN